MVILVTIYVCTKLLRVFALLVFSNGFRIRKRLFLDRPRTYANPNKTQANDVGPIRLTLTRTINDSVSFDCNYLVVS